MPPFALENSVASRLHGPAAGSRTSSQSAGYIVRSRMEEFPPEVIEAGKRCLLDWLGVTLGGEKEPASQSIIEFVRRMGGEKQASVLGLGVKTNMVNAALANGTMAHALDFDDAHSLVRSHVSAPLIAALLPVAEYKRVTGRNLITALIVGFEVSTRIGAALGRAYYEAGWHGTSIIGRFGAAAGTGRLLGLARDQMRAAFGLAATQAGGVRDVFGTMAKPFHSGKAAADGVLSAMLARSGFTAPMDILDEGSGFSRLFSSTYSDVPVAANLGEVYDIMTNSFKPYAACLLVHPVIEALILLRKGHSFDAEEVGEIKAEVAPLALAVAGNAEPESGLKGKFSLQLAAALALRFGRAGNSLFTDEVVREPEIRKIMGKVAVRSNSDLTESEANVAVVLKDGRAYDVRVTSPKGDPATHSAPVRLKRSLRTWRKARCRKAGRSRL